MCIISHAIRKIKIERKNPPLFESEIQITIKLILPVGLYSIRSIFDIGYLEIRSRIKSFYIRVWNYNWFIDFTSSNKFYMEKFKDFRYFRCHFV